MKTVSVIIPFYSNVGWLEEAIDSVLAQTYSVHEIILVNDGSKEDLSDILKKYGKKLIYIHQENLGAAAARNNGICRASGEYIAFEDSDDIWFPSKLEKQMELIESSGAKWCHCGFNHWIPETGVRRMVDSHRDYDDIFLQRHITTAIATPGVIIKRSVYEVGDYYFPEGVKNGEDDKTWTKLARDFKIALVEEPLVDVRIRKGNSYTHAIERFHLRVSNYNQYIKDGEILPLMVHLIYAFYRVYALVFRKCEIPFVGYVAKCLWAIPYFLERIYIQVIYKRSKKDESYIIRYSSKINSK